jgi:hypothetical protein
MINRTQAETAPDFITIDSEGRKVSLANFKEMNVLLVFNRGFT